MSKLHLTAKLGLIDGKYHVDLSLIEFEEENVTIIYSPALDLSGYGYNPDEAKSSFSEALQEFFRYTSSKNTLYEVLRNLGWLVNESKKTPKFNPPKDSELIAINPTYNDIVNNKSYKVSREDVEFAF